MSKRLLILFLSIIIILCGAFFLLFFNISTEYQEITYVAFGDSIAEAYAINMKSKTESEVLITGADASCELVEGSYVDLIRDELNKKYKTTAYNYAYSGDTCQDMLDFFAEFYDSENDMAKDSDNANTTYPNLTNGELYNSVKDANIITVCIGANNVLQDAPTLVSRFLEVTTPTITREEIEGILKKKILGDAESGIKGLQAELLELLNLFYKLNPNAKIYFTSVYNPYKVIDADTSLLSIIQAYYPKVTQENLNIISEIAELIIHGGKDSSNNDYLGINDIIESSIKSFNNENSINNFKFVDSKTLFDSQYSDSNRANYNNYVNIRVEQLSLLAMAGTSNIYEVFSAYFDPHPTYAGHKLIANAHISAGLEVYIPIKNQEM